MFEKLRTVGCGFVNDRMHGNAGNEVSRLLHSEVRACARRSPGSFGLPRLPVEPSCRALWSALAPQRPQSSAYSVRESSGTQTALWHWVPFSQTLRAPEQAPPSGMTARHVPSTQSSSMSQAGRPH